MADAGDIEEFESRLTAAGIAPTLLATCPAPTVSLGRQTKTDGRRSRLHTLPALNLTDDDPGDTSPDLVSIETLGEGGMGVVKLARQVALDRDVAVKTVKDKSERVAQLLLQEAYVTGYLEHPNIIPIYTVGRTDDGLPLIVMKRVEGTSWMEQLDERPSPGPPQNLVDQIEVLIQIANAVHFAHSRGIIHRDIKTENVMIGTFGEVYLVDWGLAIYQGDDRPLLPQRDQASGLCGTPGYMAPEMARQDAEQLDERTDVYLLGATLHEILTGRTRHSGETMLQFLFAAHLSEPHDYGDDVPAELAQIANQACHRDKDRRFATAKAFRDALDDFLDHRESIAISASADQKRSRLDDLLGAEQLDVATIHDTYGECRFGYLEALRMWPDNPSATQGLQYCLETMAEFHLDREQLDAARACIADLPEERPELAERTEQLARRLDDEEQEMERLKEMERDLDLSTSSETRSVLMIIFGLLWTVTSLYGGLRSASGELGMIDDLQRHMQAGFRNIAIASIGLFAFRKRIFANVANQRLAYLLLATVLVIGFLRWATWYTGTSLYMAQLSETLLIILLMLAIGLISDLRICLFSLFFVALAVVTVAFPDHYIYAKPAAVALTFGAFAWIWHPSQVDKKIAL